uniref:BTB domain-containing protein n=1 Tax=Globodera rostochiensis TaxID=31243 RepID=A0A914GTC5_GLORO
MTTFHPLDIVPTAISPTKYIMQKCRNLCGLKCLLIGRPKLGRDLSNSGSEAKGKSSSVGRGRIFDRIFSDIMANIYDEFIILDEKLIPEFAFETSRSTEFNAQFSDRIAFAELEFTVLSSLMRRLKITGIASQHSADASEPLAQIVLWKWGEGTQKIEKTITLNRGKTVEIDCYSSSVVIRILKKRELIENPCPPLSLLEDDLTVHIGDRQVTVSASWLMGVSPVIEGMLSVEMKEKQQQSLNLDGHDITMEQFIQFLEYISRNALRCRIVPNPTNVLVLLKLADYFQIDWLKERCEAHLINCVEIPLIERFLLIERYRLNILKNFFLRCLNIDKLRAFIKANHEQLLSSISKDFWVQLTPLRGYNILAKNGRLARWSYVVSYKLGTFSCHALSATNSHQKISGIYFELPKVPEFVRWQRVVLMHKVEDGLRELGQVLSHRRLLVLFKTLPPAWSEIGHQIRQPNPAELLTPEASLMNFERSQSTVWTPNSTTEPGIRLAKTRSATEFLTKPKD